MSTIKVLVKKIDDLVKHPNADTLELAIVGGWQCIVKKGMFKKDDLVVFFEPNTCLPETLAIKLNVVNYLKKVFGLFVVDKTKLRGEPSFGILIKPEPNMKLYDDVTEYYGVIKYQPRLKAYSALRNTTLSENEIAGFPKYTDIENLRNYMNVLEEDETVVVSEKIHGTNFRVGMIDGKLRCGSHRVIRTLDDGTIYSQILKNPIIKNCLEAVTDRQVILYGEIFGPEFQTFNYGIDLGNYGFRIFDVKINKVFLNYEDFIAFCEKYKLPTVPILFVGKYDFNKIKSLADGKTTIEGGKHIREGVVVKPIVERMNCKIGRVILKYVSNAFLQGETLEGDNYDY